MREALLVDPGDIAIQQGKACSRSPVGRVASGNGGERSVVPDDMAAVAVIVCRWSKASGTDDRRTTGRQIGAAHRPIHAATGRDIVEFADCILEGQGAASQTHRDGLL